MGFCYWKIQWMKVTMKQQWYNTKKIFQNIAIQKESKNT